MSGVRRPRARQTVLRLSMKVWDAPTRLFHWAIVVLVAVSYFSVQFDRVQLHYLSGYTLLSLLLFRLAWGFVGSETSRFRHFLRSPADAVRHLATFRRREADDEVGHNAAGGWMVLVLLGLLALQAVSGLFSYGDIDAEGPLRHLVSQHTGEFVAAFHGFNFNLILAAITLHVLAIAGYALVKRQNLLRPMITGRKRLPGATRQPRMASSLLALLLLALAGCLVWVLTTRL